MMEIPHFYKNQIIQLTVDISEIEENSFYKGCSVKYLKKGLLGIVLEDNYPEDPGRNDDHYIPVRFFTNIDGNTCNGRTSEGYGQWMKAEHIEVTEFPYRVGSNVIVVTEVIPGKPSSAYENVERGVVVRMPTSVRPYTGVKIGEQTFSMVPTIVLPHDQTDMDSYLIP